MGKSTMLTISAGSALGLLKPIVEFVRSRKKGRQDADDDAAIEQLLTELTTPGAGRGNSWKPANPVERRWLDRMLTRGQVVPSFGGYYTPAALVAHRR